MSLEKRKDAENVGLAAGSAGSAQNYAENVILRAERGHGFAAEKANHLYDRFTGKDAKIVGNDNAKNGADRLVNGVNIQSKYCASGSKCVSECFDDAGGFRYRNPNGTPMQIEVPSDKYEDAVKAMADRIRKGRVPGVNNPEKAKDIIRQGNFTYEQARLIAKAGTIESLTYDAANGIQLAGTAAGLSAAITFAMAMWNGEDIDKALEAACYSGLKVGGVAWVSSLITAQLGRTGLEQSLRASSDWIVKQMGPKAASWIASGLREGGSIYGAAAANNVSKLLRGNAVTTAITALVLSTADLYRLFDGRISGAQLFKNVSTTAAGVAGGVGGWQAGAAAGAAIGSIIPGVGTGIGAFVGGLLGSFAGGAAAQGISKTVLDEFVEDDSKEMSKILERCFVEQAQMYLLCQEEAESLVDELKSMNLLDELRNMYASSDREQFAADLLEPLFERVVGKRNVITLPSDEKILKAVGRIIDASQEAFDRANRERVIRLVSEYVMGFDLMSKDKTLAFMAEVNVALDRETVAEVIDYAASRTAVTTKDIESRLMDFGVEGDVIRADATYQGRLEKERRDLVSKLQYELAAQLVLELSPDQLSQLRDLIASYPSLRKGEMAEIVDTICLNSRISIEIVASQYEAVGLEREVLVSSSSYQEAMRKHRIAILTSKKELYEANWDSSLRYYDRSFIKKAIGCNALVAMTITAAIYTFLFIFVLVLVTKPSDNLSACVLLAGIVVGGCRGRVVRLQIKQERSSYLLLTQNKKLKWKEVLADREDVYAELKGMV